MQIEGAIEATAMAELNALQAQMGAAVASPTGQAAFKGLFQQFWKISLTQLRNVNLLNAIQPFLRPALGFWGATWARIEICSLALTGALASEIIFWTSLFLIAAIICIFLIMLLLRLIDRGMQVPQGPKWQPLINAMSDPTIGPVYTINTGNAPSLIELPQSA
jgi:hypothetical protein